MRTLRDWSIGERLFGGFALVLALLASFAVAALAWQRDGARAQEEFVQRVVPRSERALDLQREVSQLAVAVRAHLLVPDASRARQLLAAVGETQAALRALGELPRSAEDERSFGNLEEAVNAYLSEAEAAARLPNAAGAEAREPALAAARAAAIEHIHRFVALQRDQAQAAIASMEASREHVARGMAAAFSAIALLLVVLGFAVAASIRTPARRLTDIARSMQSGDWHAALELAPEAAAARGESLQPRDELGRIGLAFGAAASALERRQLRLKVEAAVSQAACSGFDRAAIAARALQAMADAVGAPAGAVYACEEDPPRLVPIASRALPTPAAALGDGEGLPGRAAREGRVVLERGIPPDSPWRLKLGVDELPPRSVVAVPAMLGEEALGVVVLAAPGEFDEVALELLASASIQLALGLNNARSHVRLREKNERIQAQSEELQAQREELQAQSEELQAQSEELQAQNEELQARAQQLAEADRHKNRFLGVLAHELRNPLGAIANSLYVLERGAALDERSARSLAVIQRQMRSLTRLIDDLLDITRVSHGKLQLRRETVDLVEIVREVVHDCRPAAGRSGLSIETDLAAGPVYVHGDRTRLAQVLGNLVTNAVKFSEAGGRIDVALGRLPGGDHVEVRVRDQGIGIEPELAARLFEPFSQGDSGLARGNGGLGLGLALARALVDLHGGRIEARSAGPGSGSEFVVTLPLTHAQPRVPAEPAPEQAAAPRRILLIEDNADAADTMRMALELAGHHVDVAASGMAGVEKAQRAPPEVVLCDLGIPDLDGFEVARRLRADARFARTALIALSGYAMAEDRARSSAAGFDAHLAKPVEMRALMELIAHRGQPVRSPADVPA